MVILQVAVQVVLQALEELEQHQVLMEHQLKEQVEAVVVDLVHQHQAVVEQDNLIVLMDYQGQQILEAVLEVQKINHQLLVETVDLV